jgi:gamma-glutamylputrescine oxidase
MTSDPPERQSTTTRVLRLPAQPAEVEVTDVLVVGGGIAGASAAYHIAQTGIRVTLIDRNRLAQGASAQAVGLLYPPVRQPYNQVVYDLGADAARELWDFSLRSVDGISDLLRSREEAESVELDRGGSYVIAEPHTKNVVQAAYQAMAHAGLPVRWLTAGEMCAATGGRRFSGGYSIQGGGAVDPAAAARAVAHAARTAGARIAEGLAARGVEHCSDGFSTTTNAGQIVSSAVVYATALDGTVFLGETGADLTPIQGQAFSTRPLPRRFHGAFTTDWKTNVWRQRPDGRIVVSGWRHHAGPRARDMNGPKIDRTLQNELRWWFEAAFPDLAPLPIEREWSGVWAWTPDLLPVVGALPNRPGEWVIGGFGGEGFALAFEAGRAVAHAIVGDVPVAGVELFDPARLSRHQAAAAGD